MDASAVQVLGLFTREQRQKDTMKSSVRVHFWDSQADSLLHDPPQPPPCEQPSLVAVRGASVTVGGHVQDGWQLYASMITAASGQQGLCVVAHCSGGVCPDDLADVMRKQPSARQ